MSRILKFNDITDKYFIEVSKFYYIALDKYGNNWQKV